VAAPRVQNLLLETAGAAFGYDERPVVQGVDLRVERGQFLGIVGPNGSGKTTLFRGLLGLVRPLAGSVVRHTSRIGYVPQREVLDPIYPLTVREVVQMGAYGRLRGWRALAPADRELAGACLARVGLAGRERALFSSLSGGQRQRALIARALMVRPELLLLDEPTSGVDTRAVRQILTLLGELARTEGLAILLVSHQLAMLRAEVPEALWVSERTVTRGPASEMLSPEGIERCFTSEPEDRETAWT